MGAHGLQKLQNRICSTWFAHMEMQQPRLGGSAEARTPKAMQQHDYTQQHGARQERIFLADLLYLTLRWVPTPSNSELCTNILTPWKTTYKPEATTCASGANPALEMNPGSRIGADDLPHLGCVRAQEIHFWVCSPKKNVIPLPGSNFVLDDVFLVQVVAVPFSVPVSRVSPPKAVQVELVAHRQEGEERLQSSCWHHALQGGEACGNHP